MLQLQITLLLWIFFVINNATNEMEYVNTETRKTSWTDYLLDVFYGFSTARTNNVVINICYAIFDLVLYPNSLYFTIIVLFFFILIIVILVISLLNNFGITNIHIDLDEYRRPRSRGLTDEQISKLEHVNYKTTKEGRRVLDGEQENLQEGGEDSEVMCSICYSNFNTSEKVIYIPSCNHVFHPECILAWFKTHTTCPMCRQDIQIHLGGIDVNNEPTNFLNRSLFEITDS